jgi:acetyltransferase-like isoleucine patch superfamily enzyme
MSSALQSWDKALSDWSILRGRLRARLLALRGARVGAKVTIGQRCVVDRPRRVELGARVLLEADVYLKIVSDGANLKLEDYTFVGRGVEFDIVSEVSVGRHCLIAPRCFVTDHIHGTSRDLRMDQQPCEAGG